MKVIPKEETMSMLTNTPSQRLATEIINAPVPENIRNKIVEKIDLHPSLLERIINLFTGGGDRVLKRYADYKIELIKNPLKHKEEIEQLVGHSLSSEELKALDGFKNFEYTRETIKTTKAYTEFRTAFYAPNTKEYLGDNRPPTVAKQYQGLNRTDVFGTTPTPNPHKTPPTAYQGQQLPVNKQEEYQGLNPTDVFGTTPTPNPHKTPSTEYRDENDTRK